MFSDVLQTNYVDRIESNRWWSSINKIETNFKLGIEYDWKEKRKWIIIIFIFLLSLSNSHFFVCNLKIFYYLKKKTVVIFDLCSFCGREGHCKSAWILPFSNFLERNWSTWFVYNPSHCYLNKHSRQEEINNEGVLRFHILFCDFCSLFFSLFKFQVDCCSTSHSVRISCWIKCMQFFIMHNEKKIS